MRSLLLRNIKKTYPDGFSLDIEELMFDRGGIYVIMGPNGSGKTVLLNIAGLLEAPDEGEVILDGRVVSPGSGRNPEARRRIGFVMQEPYLFNRSVCYNVAYGLRVRRVHKEERKRRINMALHEMGIENLRDRNAGELSGGEKKRVSIAQVLALGTDIVLMDEPMAHVDRATVGAIERLIHDFRKKKEKTVIITTHSLDRAYRLSGDIITLKTGRIAAFMHENTFYGRIKDSGDGMGMMTVAEGVDIHLIAERFGEAHVAIDPESILLSKERLVSSARNSFYGRITRIEALGINVRVFVECGAEFCSVITQKSYTQLGLNIGSPVYLNFKVNSVKII